MSTALWPLQTAIVQALRADATFSGLVTAVYDDIPQGSALPYVTVGYVLELASDNHSQRGVDTTVTLNVWSNYNGNKEALSIASAMDAVLDRQPLSVPGWKNVSIAHRQTDILSDPNPDIRHVSVSYRVWLTKS